MDYDVAGKTILITGGAGSFGRVFTRDVLKENPEAVLVYSRGEYLQTRVGEALADDRVRFIIGDVRSRRALDYAMQGVDVVVHAAAMKHVPICEDNPVEALQTNVTGTLNVIDAAIRNLVDRVVLISTDKAVHPASLYGATKMIAERLIIQSNAYAGKTRLSCARFGNFLGSSGSVIPRFMEQKKTGTLTVTDDRMTRFWITLSQGAELTLEVVRQMQGGEVFVPKIPSMLITDLALAIAPDAKISITGIRPGEKLHELLITEDEARHTVEHDKYYVIEPEFPFWKAHGAPVGPGFRYASDTNREWLTKDQIRAMLHLVGKGD